MPLAADRTSGPVVFRQAPAKVNLFLEVLARRPDGYHALETLMVAVNLFDTLAFRPAADLRLTCSDPILPVGTDNLVVKAADALRSTAGHSGGADINLTKRIPHQAGLAGGSSDAAATLIGLNRLWELGLSREQLAAIAAKVGSDVAFFLNPPAAWCTGRGEIVEPVRLGRRLHLVLVCPPAGLSTAQVYAAAHVPDQPISGAAARSAAESGDIVGMGRALFNRLQQPAAILLPTVKELLERLAGHRPAGCLMSGSGSTVFALCAGAAEAARLAAALRAELPGDPKPRVFVVRTVVPE